jgi:thiamine-phosphate pyrophosphorylase
MTDAQKTDKPSTPPCGLYLRIPANPDMEVWQPRMIAFQFALKNDRTYAKNMHVMECLLSDDATKEALEKAAAFVQIAQMSGIVAIINGPAKLAKMLDADGVLLGAPDDIADAREKLGNEKIIGLACGLDRGLMKQALEQGVDYITLGNPLAAPDVKLLAEWSTMSENPAAALGPITNDNAGLYAAAGATFIDTTNYMVNLEKGPLQAIVNMNYAIELALGTRSLN